MRDIQDKTDGTGDILAAAAFNTNLINELQDFVVSAGFTLDPEAGPDTDTAMFSKSVCNYSVGAMYFSESGAADAYVLTRSGSIEAMSSYFDGVTVLFKPTNSNTGASTITVDGIGVVDLVDSAGFALTGGELTAGSYAMAVYNSSSGDFELIDIAGGAGYALDSTVAHLAGTETFTGQKTFDNDIILTNDTNLYAKDTGGTNRVVARVTSSDVLEFGNILLPVNIRSTSTFTNNGNTIWTSGNDSNIAKLNGTQTFTGVNTFSAQALFTNANDQVYIDGANNAEIVLDAGSTSNVSQVKFSAAAVEKGKFRYVHNATVSSEILQINVGGVTNTVASFDGAGTLTLPETAETKIALTGANNPLISFYEGAVNKGYIRWMADGYMRIRNLEDTAEIRIKNDIEYSPNGSTIYTIYHQGNDGSGSGLDADTVDGIEGSSIARLDSNNLFNGVTLTVGSTLRDTPLAVTDTITKSVVDVSIGAVGAFSFLRPGTNGSISGMNVYDQDTYAAGVSLYGQPNTAGGNQIDYLTIDRDGNVVITTGNFTAKKSFAQQGTPTAQTTDDTLTAAELDQRIITVNQGSSGTSSQTLPTASDMDTYFSGVANNYGFEFSVINISTDAAEDATIITNTGWTLVGEMTIESNDADRANSSGRFFARKTGTAAWTLYRIA